MRKNSVKGEFFSQKFSIGEMIVSEKVGSLSVDVEIYYVNRSGSKSAVSTPVEKSVDNVEKCELSTVITAFSTALFPIFFSHNPLHKLRKTVAFYVMSLRKLSEFFSRFWGKS